MISLRAMTRDDISAVLEIEQDLFEHDPWSHELFSQELDEVPATRRVWVATEAERIVGYASLRHVGAEGDINTIAVARAYQGKGIGTLLLNELLACAYELGVRHLFLDVRSDNEPALNMYVTRGFERIDKRKNYYGTDVDAFVMRKKLTA